MKVLFLTLFIVLSDQITKLYVKGISIPALGINFEGMPYQSSIPVFGNFFKITFIENPGMAFGLQIGGKLFLSLFTIFATLLLFFFLYKNRKESLLLRISLAFILGGAFGNLIDRVFYGKIYDYAPIFYGRVVDFLHFDFPNFTIFGKTIYSWPIFNIADIAVSVGFLLILIGYKKIFKEEEGEVPLIATEDGSFIPLSDSANPDSEYNPDSLHENSIRNNGIIGEPNSDNFPSDNKSFSENNLNPEIIEHIDRFDIPVDSVLPEQSENQDLPDETDQPDDPDKNDISNTIENENTNTVEKDIANTKDDIEKKPIE